MVLLFELFLWTFIDHDPGMAKIPFTVGAQYDCKINIGATFPRRQ